ncbi:3-keto-5-aminohexanoate cleavage protein [Sporosarcina sp. GW1-11]|uniref:3-keto-5-aminohexanoate cleavage protein n=1 Tax=unclassified Sporosarcina TaxID=2647733 RepID=UPI000C16A93F|nr:MULTISPECIES: 3-keto-5-aminohexanoate cleavage protein [unclassified Sporosarcina]MDV6378720.1 3-keto-5-aminohexanoate cleavage protein [Sporosarcina sp. GW1-11]PIC62629.1 3-keto-5-aminohexanoate cleavage protein [Sporosarcina sp. P13]
MEKLIITVAPTGTGTTREDTPYLPLQPEEIADEVYLAYKAGAAIAHMHVRDKDGKPSMDKEIYRDLVQRVKEKCGDELIISLTSAGKHGLTDEERLAFCELSPDFGSLDAGSLNLKNFVFMNSPQFLEKLAKKMQENNVKPEIEVFHPGMISNAQKLIDAGLITGSLHYSIVLGADGGMPATPKSLLYFLDSLPEGASWGVVAFENQLAMNTLAISLGGHVRVGMEDYAYIRPGVLAKTNAEFVEQIKKIAHEFGREIATPAEAREMLLGDNN